MSKLPYGWEDRRNALSERDMKLVRHPAALPAAHRVPPSIPHPGESTPSIRPTEQRAPHRRAPARHQLITPDTRAERSHPSPRPKDSDLTPRRSVPFRSVPFRPLLSHDECVRLFRCFAFVAQGAAAAGTFSSKGVIAGAYADGSENHKTSEQVEAHW